MIAEDKKTASEELAEAKEDLIGSFRDLFDRLIHPMGKQLIIKNVCDALDRVAAVEKRLVKVEAELIQIKKEIFK